MSISQHWITKFAARIIGSAIVGGICTAIIGALCVGTAGAFFGWILDTRSAPTSWDDGFIVIGAIIGVAWGAWSGIVGAITFAVAALGAAPDRLWPSLRALTKLIAIGQMLGTIGAVSSYLLFAWVVAQLHAQPFVGTVEDNLNLAIVGTPTLMICGAILGALWKREAGR